MTREELANVKAKLARADEIDAELTMLDRAKHSDVLSGVCGLMDGYREVCGSRKASDPMKLGIETRIAQLEQELADITVGEPKAGRAFVELKAAEKPAWQQISKPGTLPVASVLSDRVTDSMAERDLLGANHP